ncbi:NADH dehydrogenase (ubiquinone) Fe-S protein 5 [Tremella mesenterica]|uniref:NADH dehydrogenase [ubiquinone] iron-sulfur protein 5 n=1 Tax=Tremella mesenterica TaxID=5217 RepID=A0A4Q1B8A3_TREME|nr:NADH dehydrogenase (ubiquinone) Fe-S protein 5 [Tremella mesenterica]
MASGFGYTGGRTRCFPFWQEFAKCYAQADVPNECIAPKEDYLECLHRTKEIARAKEIKSHFQQKVKHETSDARKAAEKAASGVIVSLGLVKEDEGGQ